ncbi:MAG: spondin domain-containing protein [Anaerolineae bacterium]
MLRNMTPIRTKRIFISALFVASIFLVASQQAVGNSLAPHAEQSADYQIVFEASWDPADVPNPHFSGLIGASHNSSTSFWKTGELATDGIENMAETGGTSTLRSEINADTNANLVISGGGIFPSPNSTTISSVTLDHDYPLVTLVSMIAPSPDWFVGVSGLSLIDEEGDWIDEIIVELAPYDSGTDSGPQFTSPNENTNPAEPISRIEDSDLFPNIPLGTFRFIRIDGPEPTPIASPTPVEPFNPTDFLYLPFAMVE